MLKMLPAMLPTKVLTARGYSIEKTTLSADDVKAIKAELTVSPFIPSNFATPATKFKLWTESPSRYYLPNSWGSGRFGSAVDTRSAGERLPDSLVFGGNLRPHQVDALKAFTEANRNGIICLPCGYGKTFTGIAAALGADTPRTCFLIVVHKEFLADQWTSELKSLVPGIKIGRIQGEKCEITGVDCAIAMIQTLCTRHYPVGTFERFGFALFDEVHHLGAEHFSQALQQINCRSMLGLTATPKRLDGLSKVFIMHLGPIVYEITRRPKDEQVKVLCYRYNCSVAAYAEVKKDWAGKNISACLINSIAEYGPRTRELITWIRPYMEEEDGRRLLILSDRREHLVAFEEGFRACGFDSIGYYVGGMKKKDLEVSAGCRIILGTFAMASEGMNIPALNTVLLATPKSNIEQSVGRILRLKPEERTVQPIIMDVLDTEFGECNGQWLKRRKFYRDCGYSIRWSTEDHTTDEEEEAKIKEEAPKKGVALFVDEDAVFVPATMENVLAFVEAASNVVPKKTGKKKTVVKVPEEEKGKALFVSDD